MGTVESFVRAIEATGLTAPETITADGKIHRFSSNGHRGDDAGWYVLFDDGFPAGVFGCWRTGFEQRWSSMTDTTMTAAERELQRRRIDESRRQREEDTQRRHAEAAQRAQGLWNQAVPAPADHPYLKKKQVQPHHLRVDGENRLCVPIVINGIITSLQLIDVDGCKKFLVDGQVTCGSCTLGNVTHDSPTLVLAEGYATGATLFEATQLPTVIAFSAGNLLTVAQDLRRRFRTATLIIAGDHDDSGVGQAKAIEAADAVKGISVVPDEPGDWNDVATQHGLATVRTAIANAQPPHILDEVHTFLGRFVAYPSEAAHIAHTLWIAHTHMMDAWESTPRLAFLSPEPGSGKTRALEITETLVPRPVEAMNVTPAYLFRKVSDPGGLPTVLFDEIDTLFGPRAKEHEEVRGMLNAGHRRGASAGRCVVKGKTILTEELPAYCAVAMAGLGYLPDTVLSRSVIISMRRRAPGESVEPYRRRLHAPKGYEIRDKLAGWAMQMSASLNTCPAMPDAITDRNADVWEALLSIADAAGGAWPERARVSAVTLVTLTMSATPSLGVRLLADLKLAFGEMDALSTVDLLSSLILLEESPWGDLKGKPLDARKLARFLHPYGINSKPIRLSTGVVKGYAKQDFYDAWSRYLPPTENVGDPPKVKVTTVTSDTPDQDELRFDEDTPC